MAKQTSAAHGTIRLIVVSVGFVVGVASFLSGAFRIGRIPALTHGARLAFVRLLTTTHSLAESGTDLDADTYASIASGGTDCYDSLQAQYSDFPNSSNACDSTDNAHVINLSTNIADHSWIKDSNGTWHLFFQDAVAGNHRIEHHTTTDFTNFTFVGYALAPTPGNFDSYGIWAPNVIKNPTDGLYYMFYAGVTGGGSDPNADQRIGVATSSDLTTWTKVSDPGTCSAPGGNGCVYECNNAWTTWSDNGAYDEQCRDPFVIWDSANSRWVMFTTTRFDATATGCVSTAQGINVATSTNLINWSSLGYIKATCRYNGGSGAQATGGVSENPFVIMYGSTYYLWFNDYNDPEDVAGTPNARTEQQYATATTLTADASGSTNWTYRGYTPNPGVNATEILQPQPDVWIMSQSMSNPNIGPQWVNRDLIWHRIVWGDNFTFTGSKLTNLACRVASNTIKPGGTEICSDNVDQNCSGTADEALYCAASCTDVDGDGYGVSGLYACAHPTVDTNDNDASIYPGAAEVCDSKDNNTNGQIDEGGVCPCLEQWGCGTWSSCSNQQRTRVCVDTNACGTVVSKPVVSQSCTPPACTELWSCGEWSICSRGFQARTCTDANSCGGTATQPATLKTCIVPAQQLLISLPVSARSPVQVFSPAGSRTAQFRPFTNSSGTVSLAAGDVNADDSEDIVAGSGAGTPPRIRVFTKDGRRWHEFAPFPESVRTGVQVGVGDIDGDNQRDIVATPGPGALGRISTFTYDAVKGKFVQRLTFVPVPRWRDGFELVLDDLDGDTHADLVLIPHNTKSTDVRIYRFDATSGRWVLNRKFRLTLAGSGHISPYSLATGDVNGDGQREILVATINGAPSVAIFTPTGKRLKQFAVGDRGSTIPVLVTAFDENGDGRDEVIVLPVNGRTRTIRYYRFSEDGKSVRLIRRVNIGGQADQTKEFRSPR